MINAPGSPLLSNVIRSCRRRKSALKIADATGAELSGDKALIAALVLKRLFERLLSTEERHVGVLLPPSAGAAVANLALAFDGRVAVGLNYTLTSDILNGCLGRANIRHVITSRNFLQRVPLELDAVFVFLEDLRDQASKRDKLAAALMAKLLPANLLVKAIGRGSVTPDEPLMVVFTSGTTGEPKGVVLSYDNVAAAIESVDAAMRFDRDDVIVGVLPFFHAFGSIITLWTALSLDVAIVYHPNPFDAHGVGELCRKHEGTILLATPTFLRTYQLRGRPADFASLEAILTGGERLPVALADAVEKSFGVRPVEGYGATEASALIASNVPAERVPAGRSVVFRQGTVGLSLPGIATKIVDPDTGAELPIGEQGLLLVSGRNVMTGYLERPDATAAVFRNGWYVTGDIAVIDASGRIEIVGRQSRFAKIGGEMVPLGRIEDALIACVDDSGEDERPVLAVVAIADEARGERMIVLHRAITKRPSDIRRSLIASGLPPVFAPATADFIEIDQLPVTSIGKLDYARLTALAKTAVAERRILSQPRAN